MQGSSYLWLALAVAVVVLLCFYRRLDRWLRCLFITGFTGLGGLGLLHLLGGAWATVSVTPFTLAAAAFLGLPGVVTLLIIYLI